MIQNFIILHFVIIEPSLAEVNVSQHCTRFCEIIVLFVISAVDGSVFFFHDMIQNFIIVHLVIIEPSLAEVNVSLHCTKFCELVLFVISAVD
jgi:hypothetical protein